MMTIKKNTELKGIELYFDKKPNEETRDALKAHGYRWHNAKKCWYAKETDERVNFVKGLSEGTILTPAPKQGTKDKYTANKEILRGEYSKEWKNSEGMIDYCTNKATHMVILSDGGILPIDKKTLETRFCFGESGYDYEDAASMAHHAATNFDYFRAENLKGFNQQIEAITEQIESFTTGGYILTIGKHKESNICYLHYVRVSEVLDAFGGSAYLSELPGQTIELYGISYRIPTTEELNDIKGAYIEARTKHSKRVETYLKKYGLSNVRTWTYWRDR